MTKVLVGTALQSFLVHIRPGWAELKAYMSGKASGSTSRALFRVLPVAKHARGHLACTCMPACCCMWRRGR
jgi:hypothetical protein